ncbi:MAG TPA: HAMP domain-containing sensor histidine kinase [Bacteriovoracaceae bacterium]|nr:HAMP domain-containing sensor histidine kinase [Bacteriovoracaceae bacterium]
MMKTFMGSKDSELILNSKDDWIRMLELFTKASCLIGSLYLPDGTRIVGPFTGSGFSKYLLETGKFNEGSECHRYESERVILACKGRSFVDLKFHQALTVKMIPILVQEEVVAVIVYGWVFENFPDPIECDRLAKVFNVMDLLFWQTARLQAPISKEKLATFGSMLSLLCTTLMQQLIYLREANLTTKYKDELLAVVSHELKTPLTSILLRIQMLKRKDLLPEQVNKYLTSLEASARIQAKLIDDLLDAAKVITGKFAINCAAVDLKDILTDSVETVRDAAVKKDITITCAGLEENLPYLGDAFRLQQVFWNLLSNSVKFTQPGGQINVKLTQNISSYVISFSDNGSGIEKSFIPYLFERFAQHESKIGKPSSGLGIGLSIVKTIIDLHSGSIEVESNLGEGTTFEIKLHRHTQTGTSQHYQPAPTVEQETA